MVLPQSVYGVGQLPKFEEDLFKTKRGRGHPLPHLHRRSARDQPLPGGDPARGAAARAALRLHALLPLARPASYGKDTKGIIRQHQFHKVELVAFATPEQGPGGARAPHRLRRGHPGGPGAALPPRAPLHRATWASPAARPTTWRCGCPARTPTGRSAPARWFGDFQARRANIRFRPQGRQAPVPAHPQRQRPGRGPHLGGHRGERPAARWIREDPPGSGAVSRSGDHPLSAVLTC